MSAAHPAKASATGAVMRAEYQWTNAWSIGSQITIGSQRNVNVSARKSSATHAAAIAKRTPENTGLSIGNRNLL